MPAVGFGTWMLKGETGKQAIREALSVGYRLIDTAHMYDNEAIVGQAVAESGLRREDVFITTKLCQTRAGYELAWQGIEESLARLQTDYIDLLLIHEPYAEALDMYRALTEAYRQGVVRAIGISNFNTREYLDFIGSCDIIPMVNQVEYHVYYRRKELQQAPASTCGTGDTNAGMEPFYRREKAHIPGTHFTGCRREIRQDGRTDCLAVPGSAGHRRHSEIVPSGADGGESRYFRHHPDTGRHGPDSAVRNGENPVWLV